MQGRKAGVGARRDGVARQRAAGWSKGLLTAVLLLLTLIVGTQRALATLVPTVTTVFPDPATVGEVLRDFQITVTNTSDAVGDPTDATAPVALTEVGLTPSCAGFDGAGVCSTPELDVFLISTGPTAAEGINGACSGVTFTVGARDATGRHSITPNAPVALGSADGLIGDRTCTIELTVEEVDHVPAVDVDAAEPGTQTTRQVDATISNGVDSATNADQADVTVLRAPVRLSTVSTPNLRPDGGSPIDEGATSFDTATVAPLTGDPNPDLTGTVSFQLVGPEPNLACSEPVAFAPDPVLVDPVTGEAVSPASPPLNQGNYNWVATYSGDQNYQAVGTPQGCGEDSERFVVGEAGAGEMSVSVSKTATPASLPEPGGTFTFNVEVTNTSAGQATITSLTDDIYGDLDDSANAGVGNNTCAGSVGTALAAGEALSCSFDGEFTGAAGGSETDTVTVQVQDADGATAGDSDSATVSITGTGTSGLSVDKIATPTSRPAPGGDFTFNVEVTNDGDAPIVVTGVTDDVYGDLGDAANTNVTGNDCPALVGQTVQPAASGSCSFVGEFTGTAGDSETDTVTVTATDELGGEVSGSGSATVSLTDGEAPEVGVGGDVTPASLPEPGGTFTFELEIENNSDQELEITSLDDDVHGDLGDPDNPDVNNTCPDLLGEVLVPGETATCTFRADFFGEAGDTQTNTVTVELTNADGVTFTYETSFTVSIAAALDPGAPGDAGGGLLGGDLLQRLLDRVLGIDPTTVIVSQSSNSSSSSSASAASGGGSGSSEPQVIEVRRGAGAARGSQSGGAAKLVRTGGDSLPFAALALALIMAGGTMLRARTRSDAGTPG